MIQLNINPSKSHLKQFGAIYFPLFAAGFGFLLYYRHEWWNVPLVLWGAGIVSLIVSLIEPRWIRPLYVGLMVITFPIGFVVSHVLLAVVYYGVFTPIGIIMRICGKDPMKRKFDPEADSYWEERGEERPRDHYFRQF